MKTENVNKRAEEKLRQIDQDISNSKNDKSIYACNYLIYDKDLIKLIDEFKNNRYTLSKNFNKNEIYSVSLAKLWMENHGFDIEFISSREAFFIAYLNISNDFEKALESEYDSAKNWILKEIEQFKNFQTSPLKDAKILKLSLLSKEKKIIEIALEFLTENNVAFPDEILFSDCSFFPLIRAYIEYHKDNINLNDILVSIRENNPELVNVWEFSIIYYLNNNQNLPWPSEFTYKECFKSSGISYLDVYIKYNIDKIDLDELLDKEKDFFTRYDALLKSISRIFPERFLKLDFSNVRITDYRILWLEGNPEKAEVALFKNDTDLIRLALKLFKEGKFELTEANFPKYSEEAIVRLSPVIALKEYFKNLKA